MFRRELGAISFGKVLEQETSMLLQQVYSCSPDVFEVCCLLLQRSDGARQNVVVGPVRYIAQVVGGRLDDDGITQASDYSLG